MLLFRDLLHILRQKPSISLADDMIKENNSDRNLIKKFKKSFARRLDRQNRGAHLTQILPWTETKNIFTQSPCRTCGRRFSPILISVGGIIKHRLQLWNEESIAVIRGNPRLQYFLGCEAFSHRRICNSSLFARSIIVYGKRPRM